MAITGIFGCAREAKEQIQAFYLPLADLTEGIVYEYESVGRDSFPPYYFYFRNASQEENTYLVGTQYDHNFIPQQLTREAQVKNGMLMEEAFIYVTDSMQKQVQLPTTIESGNLFPFEVRDSLGVFLYKISWYNPFDSTGTTVIRNRRFMGYTNFEWHSELHEAVRFQVREVIITQKEGDLEIELIGEEIYIKNIGLVFTSKKAIGSDFEIGYQLKDRYPMDMLEAKFRQMLQ
ncbi:MAG: hypothetical protein HC892_15575 [Saprospiraceae bacterium]|nr:hypothetical protein [Saprospiraceae bacterium]